MIWYSFFRDRIAVLDRLRQIVVKNFKNEAVKYSSPPLAGKYGMGQTCSFVDTWAYFHTALQFYLNFSLLTNLMPLMFPFLSANYHYSCLLLLRSGPCYSTSSNLTLFLSLFITFSPLSSLLLPIMKALMVCFLPVLAVVCLWRVRTVWCCMINRLEKLSLSCR